MAIKTGYTWTLILLSLALGCTTTRTPSGGAAARELLGEAPPASRTTSNPLLSVAIAPGNYAAGDTVCARVSVSGLGSWCVGAGQYHFLYDPAVLEVVGMAPGDHTYGEYGADAAGCPGAGTSPYTLEMRQVVGPGPELWSEAGEFDYMNGVELVGGECSSDDNIMATFQLRAVVDVTDPTICFNPQHLPEYPGPPVGPVPPIRLAATGPPEGPSAVPVLPLDLECCNVLVAICDVTATQRADCPLIFDIYSSSSPYCLRVFGCPERLTPDYMLCAAPGDLNGDGNVDLADAAILLRGMDGPG